MIKTIKHYINIKRHYNNSNRLFIELRKKGGGGGERGERMLKGTELRDGWAG